MSRLEEMQPEPIRIYCYAKDESVWAAMVDEDLVSIVKRPAVHLESKVTRVRDALWHGLQMLKTKVAFGLPIKVMIPWGFYTLGSHGIVNDIVIEEIKEILGSSYSEDAVVVESYNPLLGIGKYISVLHKRTKGMETLVKQEQRNRIACLS